MKQNMLSLFFNKAISDILLSKNCLFYLSQTKENEKGMNAIYIHSLTQTTTDLFFMSSK